MKAPFSAEELRSVAKTVRGLGYIVGWMRNDDYFMFMNEQPNGGFKWEFLDHEPKDLENYKPVFIADPRTNPGASAEAPQEKVAEAPTPNPQEGSE